MGTEEGNGKASSRNELTTWIKGRIVRELIENDRAESYFSESAERSGNEEL